MTSLYADDSKKNILNEFRKNLQDVIQPTFDDRFLSRWLRARNYNLENAEKMLRADLKFRKKIGSDTIINDYEMKKELQPYTFTHFLGFTKDGHPVRFFNMNAVDLKGWARCSNLMDIIRYCVYILESDVKRMKEYNEKKGTNIETHIYLGDYRDFKIRQFYDRRVLWILIAVLKVFQDHYPETAHTLYIINVPYLFSAGFNMIKPFIDDVILKKMKIYGYDGWEEMFSTIPREIVPAYLGGKRYGPNGDPLCSDLLNWNQKVLPSLYLKDFCTLKIGDPNVCEKTIQQRSVFEIEREITISGTILSWEFETKSHDIKFGLFFSRKCSKAEEKSSREKLIPIDYVYYDETVEKGEFFCKATGTYILHFDNSYSWFASKHLLYKIQVKSPSEL